MLQGLNRCWRWFGTALSFFLFGVGGALLTILIFPCLSLWPGSACQRELRARRVLHRTFRFYVDMMRALGVLSLSVKHPERFVNARLILANHPSLLDVVLLIALIPNANCVVKGRLTKHISTRGPIRQAGYILNEDGDDVVDQAKRAIAQKQTLIIFPEGTRTTPNEPVTMKRGAAQVALRSQADITPVTISCKPTTLTKQDRWYQVPKSKVEFEVEVGEVIPIAGYLQQPLPNAARALTRDLTDYFNKEIKLDEHTTT